MKKVFYDGKNNIYFKGSVTFLNVYKLQLILSKINNTKNNNTKNNNLINLHITSYGGSLGDGLLGYDLIKSMHKRFTINTIAEGCVYSAATFIFLAGNKRYMYPCTKFLIHNLSETTVYGEYNKIKDCYKNNIDYKNDMIKIYTNTTKITDKQIISIMNNDKHFNSEQCFKYGIAHHIYKN
jgi:ATP-dependent Clp protease, protease subunit